MEEEEEGKGRAVMRQNKEEVKRGRNAGAGRKRTRRKSNEEEKEGGIGGNGGGRTRRKCTEEEK